MWCFQILQKNGKVYHCVFAGVLELKSIRTGHVVIRGKSSSLFLCMDGRGQLRGQVHDKRGLHYAYTHTHTFTIVLFSFPSLFTHVFFYFRVTSLRPTALSGKYCWQMDTPASCPRTTELLCLWHLNDPQTSTQSPSLASCRSGIRWQRRACLNRHQTGRDILTWTLTIFLAWA